MTHVCWSCWGRLRPGDGFPNTLNDGECALCGDETFVAQVRAEEVASAKAEADYYQRLYRGAPKPLTKEERDEIAADRELVLDEYHGREP